MPTYYPISETTARQAKEMNSFSEYKPDSATSEYRGMVDRAAAIAEEQKARTDPMYHEKIDRLLAEFNDVILDGHERDSTYGVEFIAWERPYDGNGVWQGHYYENDYDGVRQDFTERSGGRDLPLHSRNIGQ